MVTFTDFSTESCCDSVYIYDGYDTKAPLIARLFGSYTTPPGGFNSTQQFIYIRFVSDDSITDRGFSVTYESMTSTGEKFVGSYERGFKSPHPWDLWYPWWSDWCDYDGDLAYIVSFEELREKQPRLRYNHEVERVKWKIATELSLNHVIKIIAWSFQHHFIFMSLTPISVSGRIHHELGNVRKFIQLW